MRFPISSPLGHTGGIALSDCKKVKALADNLATQFQPVTDPSVAVDIDMVDLALRFDFTSPASEPKLINLEEFQETMRGLRVRKGRGPNGIPNRTLKQTATGSGIFPGSDFQRYPPHPSLFYIVEARSSDLYSQTGGGSRTVIIQSAH